MAVMVILMVMFIVMGGHHGFGGSHQHDANPPTAASALPVSQIVAATPDEEKRPTE